MSANPWGLTIASLNKLAGQQDQSAGSNYFAEVSFRIVRPVRVLLDFPHLVWAVRTRLTVAMR